jgi:uncharacterized protein YkwD
MGVLAALSLLTTLAFVTPEHASADTTFDSTMFNLINQDRTSNGLRPLEWSNQLGSLGESQTYNGCGYPIAGRAEDMIARNYFSHQILNCGSQYVFNIMQADGLHYSYAGENIGWEAGITDPVQAANYLNTMYMNSSEHRANILSPNYTEVGLGSWATAPGASWTGGGTPLQNIFMSTEEFTAGTGTGAALPACSFPSSTVPVFAGRFTSSSASDLVAATGNAECIMTSSGSGFAAPVQWNSTTFYGGRGLLTGDVNGDGKTDMIALNNDSVWVMTSNGGGFNAPSEWSAVPFYGNVTTLLADVNGDGKADLIAVNSGSVWVMTSNGGGFNPPQEWSAVPFYGSLETVAADVSGDGKTDLVAVNGDSDWVLTVDSAGTAFNPPSEWSGVPFYGSRATLVANVDGRNGADLVAINNDSTWVMTANASGTGFNSPQEWAAAPFYGSITTIAADVSGDGKADLVAIGTGGTWVMASTGGGFSPPTEWSGSYL